ncbi:MAG: HEAT repeat domain-containing protein [Desulfobacterales bacterium]|nr:HEAT repeat domain-containing protein [Desulfobacterales bacterium]
MSRVINFEPQKYVLKKVNAYIESEELFLSERDQALPLLLKALEFADNHLKPEIIMLLGGFAEQEVSRQLYQLIINTDEDEETRLYASIYLNIIFPFLETPQPLIKQMIKELRSSDSEIRMHVAFALGWEGNTQAVSPLIELLYDTDMDVQLFAVIALSNLKDDRIFNFMIERLDQGPLEQKRCILCYLQRFYDKRKQVVSIYLKYLAHQDPEIRLDTLDLLGEVTEIRQYIPTYLECLRDKDPRIADLALNRLNEVDSALLFKFRTTIYEMLTDPNMRVKKAAMKLIKKFKGYV